MDKLFTARLQVETARMIAHHNTVKDQYLQIWLPSRYRWKRPAKICNLALCVMSDRWQ